MEQCAMTAKPLVLIICFIDRSNQCQNLVSPKGPSHKACRRSAVQVWSSAGWGVCGGFFSPQWLHFVGKSANSAAAFSWPMSRQLPDSTPQEKWAQPEASFICFFPSAPFYLMWAGGTKNSLSIWKLLWLRWMYMSFCFQMWACGVRWNTG